MPRPSAGKRPRWRRACAALALLAGACAGGHALAGEPAAYTFESVFTARGEPAALYYKAAFTGSDGQQHLLQVWRDGQSRLRRSTGDASDTYVLRESPGSDGYQMIVVDYGRRITTRISRDNLLRLGHFSDWFDLAHGLRHPAGEYTLAPGERPEKAPAPTGPCNWYELRQAGGNHRICWSERDRLPLVIWSQAQGAVWRVTEVQRQPIAEDIFQLHDAGFVHNDANQDIDGD